MLWLFIKKHFSSVIKNPNYNVLHIAAETCIKTKLNKLCAGKYLTGDLNSEIPLDITKLPLIDNFFSLIICSHVLEHVENDLLALKELYRVLKPRGRALIMVPTLGKITYENPMILCPKDREKIFGNSDHVRRYGRDFTEKLTRIGFNVHVYSTNELHGILARQLLSLRKELIFDCHK